jgi:hypothetical protein
MPVPLFVHQGEPYIPGSYYGVSVEELLAIIEQQQQQQLSAALLGWLY